MNILDKIFSIIREICKTFKVLKEKYRLEIDSKIESNTCLTKEEYERFCNSSEEDRLFNGEI